MKPMKSLLLESVGRDSWNLYFGVVLPMTERGHAMSGNERHLSRRKQLIKTLPI
jgi:hypothetical protein